MKKFSRIDNTQAFKNKLTNVQIAYYKRHPKESVWANDKYIVHIKKDEPMQNGSNVLLTHLSIRNTDNTPLRDWREMQYIKNELVGEENEGFELFPKESRLMDTANQYHIWVFQNEEEFIPIGWNERVVTDLMNHPLHKSKVNKGSTQRSFELDRKPTDNYANFKKLVNAQETLKKESLK